MKNISFKNVDITGGFWKRKQELNRSVTANAVYDRFYETGRIDSLKCFWKEGDPENQKPHFFWDSDVAKLFEGISYLHQKKSCPELLEKTRTAIEDIMKNQWEDGYINSYYTVVTPEERFTKRNYHELYCIGHLIEAAIAYTDATGDRRFIECMEKCVDYVEKAFITEGTAAFKTPGHEEIELALIKLYKATDNKKYLDIAAHFINARGVATEETGSEGHAKNEFFQSHIPVREQKSAMGHSVRAVYLYTAMAGLALETRDESLKDACLSLFDDIVNKKMYVTGGIGSSHIGEAFTIPYDLPNEHAYAETCASIGMIFFCLRLLTLDHNAKYSEIIERELYNGALSGLSLDGGKFFYENPLEINLKNHNRNTSIVQKERFPITQRVKMFDCSCCPPNIVRLLASLGDYIYTLDEKTVWVEQFIPSTAESDGIKITQSASIPQKTKVTLSVSGAERLGVRIPSWCDSFKINVEYTMENGYAMIDSPSKVEIEFEIRPILLSSNVDVGDNVGKGAVQYGPFIYCFESIDNTENLNSLYIDKSLSAEPEYMKELDSYALKIKGFERLSGEALYERYSESFKPVTLTAVPYHTFANRGECNMTVWIRVK